MPSKTNFKKIFYYLLFIFLFSFLTGCGGGSGDSGGNIPFSPASTPSPITTPPSSEGLKASSTSLYGDQTKTVLTFTGGSFGSSQGKVEISNLTSTVKLRIIKWTKSEIQIILNPSVLAPGKYFFTINIPYTHNSPSKQLFLTDFNIISPKVPFIKNVEFAKKPVLGEKIDTLLIKGDHFWKGLTPPGNIKFFIYYEGTEPIPLTIKTAFTDENGDQITASPASPFPYKGKSILIKGSNGDDANTIFPLSVSQLGKIYSVFIGINNYQQISDLSYCVADSEAMQNSLDTGSLNDLWASAIKIPLHDDSATKITILNTIENISSQMAGNDIFFMYYSGHGSSGDRPPLPTSEAYICPVDCKELNTAISSTELKKLLLKMPASSTKILCFDSCFSGGFIVKAPSSFKAKYFKFEDTAQTPPETGTFKNIGLEVQNYFFLSASSYSEFSWEESELGHGVFTWGLLTALGADGSKFGSAFKDGNSAILIQDTYSEAAQITRIKASEHGWAQNPQFFTNPEKENFPIKGNLK